MKSLLSRISGFAANGIVTGIATLISLTLIIRLHGSGVWSIFAVAQASGLMLAVLVGFGWAVLGPAIVARLSSDERPSEFLASLTVRITLYLALVGLAAILLLSNLAPGLNQYVPVTLAYASTGFSSLWYYVGTAQSWASFIRDALPRAIASILAPLAALYANPQWTIGAVVLAGNLTGMLLTTLFVTRGHSSALRQITWARIKSSVMRQRHGVMSGGVSALYMTLPTVVVGGLTTSVASFALGDKFIRLASTATLPLTQVLQGWVPRVHGAALRSRVRRALSTMALIGSLLGVLLAALAPWIAQVFTAGKVQLDWSLSIPMGIILGCTLITQVAGAGCLAAYGDFSAVAISAAIGASVGVPALLILTSVFGAPGAMSSVALAELSVLTFQLFRLRMHSK